jgi:enoyl-CoA hydratase
MDVGLELIACSHDSHPQHELKRAVLEPTNFKRRRMQMGTVEMERIEAGIATLRLNRPDRLNAMNFDLVCDLHDALDRIALDDTCKVVILTGNGRAFCSGLDLKDWGELPPIGAHSYRRAGSTGQSFMSSLTTHIRETPQIVIASVNGPAFGGGLALTLACDLRVAGDSASFCSAFIRTGLTGTDIGVSYFLPRLIGASMAFDLMVTGRAVDSQEAHQMGIVSRVFPDHELAEETLEIAQGIASYTAIGLRMTKEAMWANLDASNLQACLALENRNQDLAGASPEVQDFMRNYRDRHGPAT